MNGWAKAVFPFCVFIVATVSSAQPCRATPVTCDAAESPNGVLCRTVVPDVHTLQTNSTPGPYITITCYYNGADPTNLCAGGGDFDRATCDSSVHDNGATLLKDASSTPYCYYRKNFGLNGVVDARQCGVYGDGTHDDGAALNKCLAVASQQPSSGPPLPNSYHIVTTGGGVILSSASIDIPAHTELTCGGNNWGSVQGSAITTNPDDYRIFDSAGAHVISSAIVLDPTSSVVLNNHDSSFTGCLLEAGIGGSSNPYSPSVWYPSCDPAPGLTLCNDSGMGPSGMGPFLRSAIDEYSAFNPNLTALYAAGAAPAANGVGILLTTSGNLRVENVTVLVFESGAGRWT